MSHLKMWQGHGCYKYSQVGHVSVLEELAFTEANNDPVRFPRHIYNRCVPECSESINQIKTLKYTKYVHFTTAQHMCQYCWNTDNGLSWSNTKRGICKRSVWCLSWQQPPTQEISRTQTHEVRKGPCMISLTPSVDLHFTLQSVRWC